MSRAPLPPGPGASVPQSGSGAGALPGRRNAGQNAGQFEGQPAGQFSGRPPSPGATAGAAAPQFQPERAPQDPPRAPRPPAEAPAQGFLARQASGRGGRLRIGRGGAARSRVVPPSGFTVWLTVAGAAAMAFLAVFALALSLAADRLADRWSDALSRTATIRISAPPAQLPAQAEAVLRVLATTPGIGDARRLSTDEKAALLAPWLGEDLPLDLVALPELIQLTEADPGYDSEGLRLRLMAEAPGAQLDDHGRWRRPLAQAASRLRLLGSVSTGLIALAMAAMVVLAATAALAANRQVIRTLRLVGATDRFIAGAFVQRFTLRTAAGALAGTLAAMAALALMPGAGEVAGVLTGLRPEGSGWMLPLAVPPLAALVAFGATLYASVRMLRETK